MALEREPKKIPKVLEKVLLRYQYCNPGIVKVLVLTFVFIFKVHSLIYGSMKGEF